LKNKLSNIYGIAKVCQKDKCLVLEPDIAKIMSESRDYDKLLYVWKGWRDATGRKMRKIFTQSVEIQNKAAKESGYKGNQKLNKINYLLLQINVFRILRFK